MVRKRQELSPTKRNVPPTQVKKETGTKIENNRNVQFEWSGFLRNEPRLPNFSNRSPNMEEMFKICLLSKILSERLVKIKLTRVQEAATFVVASLRYRSRAFRRDLSLHILFTLRLVLHRKKEFLALFTKRWEIRVFVKRRFLLLWLEIGGRTTGEDGCLYDCESVKEFN